tara:strand:- start:641 stop:1321 length:681 start_codon:yes stop_codon:yes gene_type:complete
MKLKAPSNRVIIKVDLESKNSHTFKDGTKIKLERVYDNFNMRYVKPVNAEVVDGKDIPTGAEILIHHNATHDTYKIFNYQRPTTEASSDIQYFSIPIEECFMWREGKGSIWNALNNFVTALRIFKPYKGMLQGIEPEVMNNKLYITSGELKGRAVNTVISSDYEIIYQNDDGTEGRIIRLRYFPDGNDRNEIIAINDNMTELVESGELLVGYNKSDAKQLKEAECL